MSVAPFILRLARQTDGDATRDPPVSIADLAGALLPRSENRTPDPGEVAIMESTARVDRLAADSPRGLQNSRRPGNDMAAPAFCY
jgi:hypothetical protein